jgi:hypothetical protein
MLKDNSFTNEGDQYWEKSDSVLWVFTPNGILLHNLDTDRYVELNSALCLAWSYIDGVHSLDEIRKICFPEITDEDVQSGDSADLFRLTVQDLVAGRFIQRSAV